MSRARASFLDYVTAAGASDKPFAVGVVTNVIPGGAKDGNGAVAVDYYGTKAWATYGDHYTPAVGHVVLLANTKPLAVLIRLIGTPPDTPPPA